jgi:hypothetical protein
LVYFFLRRNWGIIRRKQQEKRRKQEIAKKETHTGKQDCEQQPARSASDVGIFAVE